VSPMEPAAAAELSTEPDAAADPTTRVSRGWTTRFTLLWLGFWMAWLVPVQLLLPNQLAAVDSAHKVKDFGLINGAAGLAALIALPLAGALCDRTRTRFGRRRTWIAAGIVVFVIALIATGQQHQVIAILIAWVFASIGFSMASAGAFAAVADQVPVAQRGMISAAIFGPQALGLLLGLAVLTTVITSTSGGYIVLAVAVAALSVPFVLRYRETLVAAVATPLNLRQAMWVSPRAYPDFAWAFGGRVMVNIGNALGTTYLLYFLRDYLKLKDAENALLVATAIYLVFTLLTTYGGGVLSDRTGRRRRFVAIASLLQGVAAVLLVGWPSFDTTLVAAAFLGAGYGAFLSVDQALVTQVLPGAETRSKDLGIMSIGTNVPQALAPVAAALVIDQFGGYRSLFGVAGLFSILGATMVYRIRSVK
jgi:MFS family permease